MHKIGILSDTHGLLRPEAVEALRGSEYIFHAGDINKQSILDQLNEICPVYVVRGNNDKEWAKDIPETLTMNIFGLSVFMIHNKKFIPKEREEFDLIIYGHSHKYEEKEMDGTRYLNPGSCGPRRFHQEITLAVLTIADDQTVEIRKVLIPHPEKKKTEDVPLNDKLPAMITEIHKGKSVLYLSKKYGMPEDQAEQIVRMVLTHPGIDAEGVKKRLE